jgi:hypothetical protein
MREPKNHPAFPVEPYPGDEVNPPVRSNSGMSIRDFIAALAMVGLVDKQTCSTPEHAAESAYAFADAMLEERAFTTRK